jgi:hypothetical protein
MRGKTAKGNKAEAFSKGTNAKAYGRNRDLRNTHYPSLITHYLSDAFVTGD